MTFARHLLAATVLVAIVVILGVGLEHSALSQAIAPHDDVQQAVSLVHRDGHVYVKIETGPKGHLHTELHEIKYVPSAGHPVDLGGSRSDGVNASDWPQAVAILLVIVAGACVVALLDRLRRAARRARPTPVGP